MFEILKNKSLIKKFIDNSKIQIVRPARADIDIAAQWTAEENWNPGINDADIYYKTDPSGFFMGVYNKEPIGFVFSIAYDNDFTVAGVFIVKKEFRNKRLGAELGFKFLPYLKDKNVSINAVQSKIRLYSFIGFKPAFNINRYCFIKNQNQILDITMSNYKVIALKENFPDFDSVYSYDKLCFPADRSKLLSLWLVQPQSFGLCVKDEKNNIRGYGIIRKAFCGYRFEPLYADNIEIAELIFLSALKCLETGAQVFIDIPENNKTAALFAQKFNFFKIFSMTRMYKKFEPPVAKEKVYGMFE
ncbi:MAG TPA: hypothetical protein PKY81_07810 [bacterium]|nr:hypothetical protein [bacterium]HPN30848.1 hypothetical protein [bacterium]